MDSHPGSKRSLNARDAGGGVAAYTAANVSLDPANLAIHEHLQARGRPRPHQLRRAAQALAAWAREGKPVSASHLAISAGVPVTIARSLCAELEQMAILGVDAERRYIARVDPDEIEAHAVDLAGRFEVLRREDGAASRRWRTTRRPRTAGVAS